MARRRSLLSNNESLDRALINCRWRRGNSDRLARLFRRAELVWKVARRHSLRRRTHSRLHSAGFHAAGVARPELDHVFAAKIPIAAGLGVAGVAEAQPSGRAWTDALIGPSLTVGLLPGIQALPYGRASARNPSPPSRSGFCLEAGVIHRKQQREDHDR